MFESLTQKLQGIFQQLRGKGTLKEQDITEALREVRLALLEADVNFRVVRDLCARIKERAVGQEVLESLTPSQQVIKIVHEELCTLLGADEARIEFAPRPPTVILMVGLQGSGKTTTCAKLAHHIRRQGRRTLFAACDIYRPAAIRQLEIVAAQVGVPVVSLPDRSDVVEIARAAVQRARDEGIDVVLVDTAGRLHIDEAMMDEVARLAAALQPQEVFLVLDAMTGQDAVNVAQEFAQRLPVTGFILTKLDGDTRGGAALSVRAVTGKPIKFVGVGEKPEMLEPFHPDRMAARILGMGDLLSFIERAQQVVDEKQALALQQKIRANRFDLEDFLNQLQNVRKMGPLQQVLQSLPFFGGRGLSADDLDERELIRFQAIIQSMTREERRDPSILNGSRRRRIARGSGTTVQEVNALISQYQQLRRLFQEANEIETGRRRRGRGMRVPFFR